MASHQCPAPNCTANVPQNMLACRRDWYRLPREVRNRVWAAWYGPGPGSDEHNAAVAEATAWYAEHAEG